MGLFQPAVGKIGTLITQQLNGINEAVKKRPTVSDRYLMGCAFPDGCDG